MSLTKEAVIMILSPSQRSGHKNVTIEEVQRVPGMSPCWLITSHVLQPNGYVQFNRYRNGAMKQIYAHRAVLALKLGFNPGKLDASHLCEVAFDINSRRCVNPDHIVAETRKENVARSATRNKMPNGWYKYHRTVAYATACVAIR